MLRDEGETYELLGRSSSDLDVSLSNPKRQPRLRALFTRVSRLFSRWTLGFFRHRSLLGRIHASSRYKTSGKRQKLVCAQLLSVTRIVAIVFGGLVGLSLLRAIVYPSYQDPPAHYQILREAVASSSHPGRGNPNNEKVFIATNMVKEDLIRGAWGKAMMELVTLLGEVNVFVSVYENDSGKGTIDALKELRSNIRCNSSIVTGDHLPLEGFPTVVLPTGEKRVKRIAYLAELRNRALRPLDVQFSPSVTDIENGFRATSITYDRILFINDVYFTPLSALHLLFSTNLDVFTGRPSYRAACGIDFWHYAFVYDTFAIRDLEGFGLGYGLYPWFAPISNAGSRQDVLDGKDAVRVRSCWSGIVAFDAAPFQASAATVSAGATETSREVVRYRYEPELYVESSECCLVHADLIARSRLKDEAQDTGIYINPFVRVTYEPAEFSWLAFIARYERSFAVLQYFVSKISYPSNNPRRLDRAGEEVTRNTWIYDDQNMADSQSNSETSAVRSGSFKDVTVVAGPGGFCAWRALYLMLEVKSNSNKEGKLNWEYLSVPEIWKI
ncbi:hypothetical protein MMC11_003881 [Xylographa trunciseda]|nr:hypothetical protein [Xylographa trunciseda]